MKNRWIFPVLCFVLFAGGALLPLVQGLSLFSGSDFSVVTQGNYSTGDSLVLPSSFSWRDINGVDFTTPIRNQTPYPSCESFALTAAVETMVQYQVGFPFNCDLSEAHLFFFSGGNIIWGSYPENDTEFLKDYGIPDEACWPYPKDKYQYPLNTTSPDWQNRTVKITNWSYIPADPIAIKTALLTNGPVPSYFLVYDDFVYFKKGIYQHRWGNTRGAHYMAIVGYNDDPGYWIVKNSWGTKFQDEGWVNIKYGECGIGTINFLLTGVYGKFPIIYVDDDNTAGPWNGTKEYPYQTIQDALGNVFDGYTIYVMNGTYHEHVYIQKRITLMGEKPETTIIDGDGLDDVVTIAVPDVKIIGLTVQHSGQQLLNAGIKTLSLNSNATFENNILQNNAIGLFLNYGYAPSWNIVRNNTIRNNVKGIYTHWANNGDIRGNTITQNAENGLEMECSKYSQISGNVISENGGYGIYLRGESNKNTITGGNIIQDNAVGVKLSESNGNKITKNNFIGNLQHATFYNSFLTTWNRNYWDDRFVLFPEVITGSIGKREFTWMNIDWYPLWKPFTN
jgi:parallel beta-helix repeat protein